MPVINEFRGRLTGVLLLEKAYDEGKHKRDAKGRFANGGTEGREPWHSSSAKAKELKISHFGTLDEFMEMAEMPRTAKNRAEAVARLNELAAAGNLKNKSGLAVSLSGKSIDKIVSGQAAQVSFDRQAHWKAAANLDKLFRNAVEPWKFELNPGKANENLKTRRYFYAPMEHDGKVIAVKMTVKEFKDANTQKRLYTIEAINIALV